jgi:arylsulfatase A-like enzyme
VRVQFERTAGNTLTAIREWLDSSPPQPFFLFTNFIDPHGPYTPPDRFRKLYPTTETRLLKREQIPPYQLVDGQLNYFDYVDRYDGEITYTDDAMRGLIEELKRRGLWDDALVVFTADHGEYFGEHNAYFEHHFYVWDETAHVPLAIRLPGTSTERTAGQRRIGSVCSPMDLMPTILSYLNLPCDVRFDGRDLLPLMEGKQDDARAILLEFPAAVQMSRKPNRADVYAARTTTHKLIRLLHPDTGVVLRQAVYDLVADPREQRGLRLNPQDAVHKGLASQLDAMVAQVRSYQLPFTVTVYEMPSVWDRAHRQSKGQAGKTIRKRLTTDQAERLRSLGYGP